MHFILIFDADNTLWDTNAVFGAAQAAMLETFEGMSMLSNARSRIEELRTIDRALIQRLGRYEYDFKILAIALAYHYGYGLSPTAASEHAVEKGEEELDSSVRPVIENAYKVYVSALKQIPPLLPGVIDVLAHIRAYRTMNSSIATIIFSEGDPGRLKGIMEAHSICQDGYFDEIIVEPKTTHAFQRAGNAGRKYLSLSKESHMLTVVIGDSIRRDIRYANEAGFTTVYIPGAFEGREVPQAPMDCPHFQLDSILKLPSILKSLGLSL